MRSPSQAFEQFRALVERDPSLQERLYQPDDPAVLIDLIVAVAHDHGLSLDAAEVAAAISAKRRLMGAAPPCRPAAGFRFAPGGGTVSSWWTGPIWGHGGCSSRSSKTPCCAAWPNRSIGCSAMRRRSRRWTAG
jgi:hypothetical protein